MDGRNGKWVNVDYTNRILEESVALSTGVTTNHADANSRSDFPAPDRHYERDMASSTHSNPSSTIQVTVSEPVKQGEGMNAYISYKISTTTTRPQFSKSSFSVVRRYSDFVWIHSHLNAMHPGVVVPPLPEKLLVGRFSPEFVESRRRALQIFLNRCCLHPELQHSQHLTTFLEASEDQLQSFRKDPRHAAPNAQRGVLFQWLDDTVNTISSTLSPLPIHLLPKTIADMEVDETMTYIEGLEPILTGLHKHAHGLTKRAREIADGLFEFGVSFTLLSKSEDNPSLQEGLNQIGYCSDRLSILAAEQAEREALHFEEPIFDYIRLVGAVKAALQKRNDLRCAYGAAVATLEAKEAILSKAVKHARGRLDEKVQGAEMDVRTAHQQMKDAKRADEVVTERVLREVERFTRAKLADIKHIILDYIQLQIEYSKQVEDEWQKILPQLAMIQVEHKDAASTQSAAAGGASHGVAEPGPRIQEDYIPLNDGLEDSLATLTLMTHDSALQSPYDSRPMKDSNPDVL